MLGGLVAGVINTLAGGGSLITVPLLVFMGLPATTANGTNRIGVLFQNGVAIWRFRKEGLDGLRGAAPVLVPVLIGSAIGAALLVATLAALALLLAIRLFFYDLVLHVSAIAGSAAQLGSSAAILASSSADTLSAGIASTSFALETVARSSLSLGGEFWNGLDFANMTVDQDFARLAADDASVLEGLLRGPTLAAALDEPQVALLLGMLQHVGVALPLVERSHERVVCVATYLFIIYVSNATGPQTT